jgi:hypothetical protein
MSDLPDDTNKQITHDQLSIERLAESMLKSNVKGIPVVAVTDEPGTYRSVLRGWATHKVFPTDEASRIKMRAQVIDEIGDTYLGLPQLVDEVLQALFGDPL